MSEEQPTCPHCGAALRSEDSEGLCTQCLFGLGYLDNSPDRKSERSAESPSSQTLLRDQTSATNESVPDADNLLGKMLGVYEITGVLGRGGMGVVYKARDHTLDRWVAVKVLAPRIRAHVDFVERFLREAQAAARLTHPNIVSIHGIGEEEGYRFYVMEYVRGVNLAEYLKEQGTLSPWQALNLAVRVTSALEAAHVEGIIHRDIKPQNIMIDEAGRVRVLDFGLAKVPDPETLIRSGIGFLGTPQYASPEQCAGREIDRRSDLYSLGVVLYECLSGRPAHSADTPLALLKSIVESDPPALSSVRAGVAPEIEDLVHRLLARNPARRFQSAGELLRSIERLMDDPRVARGESEEAVAPRVVFAAELAGVDDKHVALFKECLEQCSGEVLEASDEAPRQSVGDDRLVASFNDAMDAIHCAFEFQDRLRKLGPGDKQSVRIAIHEHEAHHPSRDSALLPPPEETLGRPLDTAIQMLELAGPNQILLTHRAFDSARRRPLRESGDSQIAWLAHGPYRFEALDETLEIFEVGLSGHSPLVAPPDSLTAKSATRAGDEITLGWRPAIGREIPLRPNWRLEESRGEGGFGEVWLARHKKSQDRRIFKFCFQADRLRALKREVMLLRLLKETLGDRHDISKLLDWNFDQAPFFIESEYTEGGSLKEWADAQGGIENVAPETRLDIIAQTATALAAAHSVGVIHKDIKPTNVLIAKDQEGKPQAVLADFGIGLITEGRLLEEKGITVMTELASGRTTSSATGTHLYMAPELHSGAAPSSQSDIYSLGVLFYQMVVGDLSQPAATDWERRVSDPLLREDLHQCLAGDPADRFAGVNEVARRIRTLPRRRRRRNLTRMARAAALLLVLVAVVVGAGFLLRTRELRLQTNLHQETERQFYDTSILSAEKLIENESFDSAMTLLEKAPPHLRSWEWGYLLHRCNPDVLTLSGHTDDVFSVDFSPDGRRVATASLDKTLRIWSNDSGEELLRIDTNLSLRGCAFSPDGLRVAGAGYDSQTSGALRFAARIWDAKTGDELLILTGHTNAVTDLDYAPDGRRIVTAGYDKTARIWDAETGQELRTLRGHTGEVERVEFSPDGRRVATAANDRTARIWDAETGQELCTLKGHNGSVWGVAFSPDGERVLTASMDGTGALWSAQTGGRIATFQGPAENQFRRACDFSPDGNRVLIAGSHRRLEVWTLEPKECQDFVAHSGAVHSVCFSPDGGLVATAGEDNKVKIWDLGVVETVLTLPGQRHDVRSVFSPDGRRVATADEHYKFARVWDAETGRELTRLNGHSHALEALVFSPDSKRIATTSRDGTARIWDAETGQELLCLRGHASIPQAVAFSPDGRYLATGAWWGEAKTWDARTGKELHSLDGHSSTAAVTSIAYGPQGQRILTLTKRSVRVWDSESGHVLHVFEKDDSSGDFKDAAFSPDGRRILTVNEESVRIREAASGEILHTFEEGDSPGSFREGAFSPDGSRALAVIDDQVRVWNVESGRRLLTIRKPNIQIVNAALSPDGRRIVTGCESNEITIWNAETGRELYTYVADREGWRCRWDSGGRRLLCTSSFRRETFILEALPWTEEDLPGDAEMPLDRRIQLCKLQRWKRIHERLANSPDSEPLPVVYIEEWQSQLEACVTNLEKIHAALVQYRSEHDDQMPDWLSDLVPAYLSTETLLCPCDPNGLSSAYAPQDPHLPCSYSYEFSPEIGHHSIAKNRTWREWKTAQLKEFGDRVPPVRCGNHRCPGCEDRYRLNLSYGGEIFWSDEGWENRNWEDYVPGKAVAGDSDEIELLRQEFDRACGPEGEWERLPDLAREIAQHSSATAEILNSLAWKLAATLQSHPHVAVDLAKEAVARDPEEGNYFDTLGWAELRAGDYAQAVCSFQEALQKRPELGVSAAGLSIAFARLNLVDPAWGALARALKTGVDDRWTLNAYYEASTVGPPSNPTVWAEVERVLGAIPEPTLQFVPPVPRVGEELRVLCRDWPGAKRLDMVWGVDGWKDPGDEAAAAEGAERVFRDGAGKASYIRQPMVREGGAWSATFTPPPWARQLDLAFVDRTSASPVGPLRETHLALLPPEVERNPDDLVRFLRDKKLADADLIEAMSRSGLSFDEETRRRAYAQLVSVPLDQLPGNEAEDTYGRVRRWRALLAEAPREFDRLAGAFDYTFPVRTADDARKGVDAWTEYLDKFASTIHRIDEATRFRDWFANWLAEGAIPPATQSAAPFEEPEPGTLHVVDMGGGQNLELVWIPTGEFVMGSPQYEEGREEIEGPQTWVPVEGFWMGRYEVTVAQFRRFVEATAYQTDAEKAGQSMGPFGYVSFGLTPGLTWRNPGFEQTDRHPVVCVSWNDAMAFCRWLSEKEGVTFTLPTEAQGEYTCRAGSAVLWPWGDDPAAARLTANLADGFWKFRFPSAAVEPWYDGFTHTAPVGRFQPNKWGLYDRIGNANEWSLSLEKPYPYIENDGRNNLEVNGRRAIRGGSHCDTILPCRSARRWFCPEDYSSSYDGFRVVQLRE